jgi:hypothetical protein
MQPTTKNGKAPRAAKGEMSLGNTASDTSTTAAQIAKLIHQRERIRTANREFSAIFNFTGCLSNLGQRAALSPVHRGWTASLDYPSLKKPLEN